MPVNINLLRRIQQQIQESPNTFNMDYWECGTTCCIGGWALRLAGEQFNWFDQDIQRRAAEGLGLTPRQAQMLFHVAHWPKDLRYRHYRAWLSPPHFRVRLQADIASERIERLIAEIAIEEQALDVAFEVDWNTPPLKEAAETKKEEFELCPSM